MSRGLITAGMLGATIVVAMVQHFGRAAEPTTPRPIPRGSEAKPEELKSTDGKPSKVKEPNGKTDPATDTEFPEYSFRGVYVSPSEIGGFSRTKLVIEKYEILPGCYYRMTSSSCVRAIFQGEVEIEEKEKHGEVLSDGDKLYIPEATGRQSKEKIELRAGIERYTRVMINGRTVLMRDDALKAWTKDRELYDYGILIKVGEVDENADADIDLAKVRSESIKVLYKDQTKPWNDPFIHGPNKQE
ncbi:MAG: hypothetical protein QM811_16375 [Pirellulales bacterium]